MTDVERGDVMSGGQMSRRQFTRLGVAAAAATVFAGETKILRLGGTASAFGATNGNLVGKIVAHSQAQPIEAISAFIDDMRRQAHLPGNGEKIIATNAHGDASLQLSQAAGFLTQDVDAVVFWGTSTSGWAQFAKQATAKGIGVFTHNASALSNTTQNIVLNQYQAGYGIGSYAAEWIHKNLGGKGDVGILENTTDPQLILRGKGFADALKKVAPGSRVVGRASAQTTAQGASAAANLLSAHPTISVILSASDDSGVGAMSAAREQGHNDPRKFLLGSCDGSNRVLNLIKSGGIYQVTWDFLFPFSAVQMERDIERFLRGQHVRPTRLDPGILVTKRNLARILRLSSNPTSPEARAMVTQYMTTYSDYKLKTDEPPSHAFPKLFGK